MTVTDCGHGQRKPTSGFELAEPSKRISTEGAMGEDYSFDKDYDGHTGKRIYIPEFDPAIHIRQRPLVAEIQRRIPGVGFNRVWRAVRLLSPAAKLTTKTRLPHGRKAYRQAVYRNRLNNLETLLRQLQQTWERRTK